MTKALSITAAVSLVAQAAFFVGLGFLVADLLSLATVIAQELRESSLRPYVQETIASYQAVLWPGFFGAVVYYVIYFRKVVRARWFLAGARVLGWLWLLLIPIGGVVGIILIT